MRLYRAIVCFLCLSLLLSGHSVQAEHVENVDPLKPVTILSFEFPPLLHTARSGEFSGTMGETVKMLCEEAGLICRFRVVPLKRAYQELRNDRGDALVTIDLGQFNKCCLASKWAAPWSAGWFSMPEHKRIPANQEELEGEAVIVVQGMKSPYSFAPKLDEMAKRQKLSMFKATDIATSVGMFIHGRAPLLWGGEDFRWYFRKIDPQAKFVYTPRMTIPVVIWMRKERSKALERLNRAYQLMIEKRMIGENGLLEPSLMGERYQDAPFGQ